MSRKEGFGACAKVPLIFCLLVSSNFRIFCFTAAACECCCFAFFSLSFPHYVTPTERERQTEEKNGFLLSNTHNEPGAPVSLEQGEKPRRAEKAKTPSDGTIGVEIGDIGRGVE